MLQLVSLIPAHNVSADLSGQQEQKHVRLTGVTRYGLVNAVNNSNQTPAQVFLI